MAFCAVAASMGLDLLFLFHHGKRKGENAPSPTSSTPVGPRYIVAAYHIKIAMPITPSLPHELDDAAGITRKATNCTPHHRQTLARRDGLPHRRGCDGILCRGSIDGARSFVSFPSWEKKRGKCTFPHKQHRRDMSRHHLPFHSSPLALASPAAG